MKLVVAFPHKHSEDPKCLPCKQGRGEQDVKAVRQKERLLVGAGGGRRPIFGKVKSVNCWQ